MMLKIFFMFVGASIASYLSLGAKGTRIQREAEYNMLLNYSHTKSNCSIETEIIDVMNKTIINIESQLYHLKQENIMLKGLHITPSRHALQFKQRPPPPIPLKRSRTHRMLARERMGRG